VDPGPLSWLLDMLHDAGTCRREFTMSGVVFSGLGWPEIVAWIEGAGQHDVSPFWRRAIMQLSRAFADQLNAAQALACDAPFDPGKDG